MELSRKDFVVIEEYNFMGQQRFRVQVRGTNIVFNVEAGSREEAVDKAIALASRVGLTKEVADTIRERVKAFSKERQ